MSQRQTVLQMLRDAGPHGVHTADIYGEFIANPSERIRELKAEGYGITAEPERLAPDRAMGARYVLVHDAEPSLGGLTAAERPHGACPTSTAEMSIGSHGHAEAASPPPVPSLAAIAPGDPVDSLFDAARFAEPTPHWRAA